MKKSSFLWFGRSLAVIAAALSTACGDTTPVSPTGAAARGVPAVADIIDGNRLPILPAACQNVATDPGSTLVLQAFGVGVQIYTWDGSTWTGPVPRATLYADATLRGIVAQHFAGPTWQSNSGGKVKGTAIEKCTPDAASIPWVKLAATPDGAGLFQDVAFIQRLSTIGGNAPTTNGTVVGQVAEIPYTADYLFYKAP